MLPLNLKIAEAIGERTMPHIFPCTISNSNVWFRLTTKLKWPLVPNMTRDINIYEEHVKFLEMWE